MSLKFDAMVYTSTYLSPIGELYLLADKTSLLAISFAPITVKGEEIENEITRKTTEQLEEYFQGIRKVFDLPLHPEGTPFQKKVWEVLREIPYGETWNYKQVAEAVGNPKASRAVGMANNKNPLPIVVPCHRLIGANGKLIGYAGGLRIKEQLLLLEKSSGKSRVSSSLF